jgi:hypothetical protein
MICCTENRLSRRSAMLYSVTFSTLSRDFKRSGHLGSMWKFECAIRSALLLIFASPRSRKYKFIMYLFWPSVSEPPKSRSVTFVGTSDGSIFMSSSFAV